MASLCLGEERTLLIEKGDSGRAIGMVVGQKLEIRLAGIPGTGYWWHFTELDNHCFEVLSERIQEDPGGKRLGGPAMGRWELQAMHPGRTKVEMAYFRIWEGADSATDRFSLDVDIRNR